MSTQSVKSLCEELVLYVNTDENVLKTIIKIYNLLKVNDKFQKEIFINLSDKGLSKLMFLMKCESIDIRKMSVKLLIEMMFNNEVLQNIFCEKFNFNPIGNIICLNWFPKVLKENLTLDANIINDIKSSKYQSKYKYWIWPQNSKYNDENFPDPQKYLIGFYYSNKAAYIMPNTQENLQLSENIKSLILKLEREEENEENNKGNMMKIKIEQVLLNINEAAGSGSESSTKIREKKSDSENFEKFLKTEPAFHNEDIKKTEVTQPSIGINKFGVQNKGNKIINYANQGNNVNVGKTNQRNVSPFNNRQIIFNVKTKIDKKAFLNSSDIPIVKTETSYKNEKTKTKHNYSRSIDTRDHNDNQLTNTNNTNNAITKKTNKSPIPNHNYKK